MHCENGNTYILNLTWFKSTECPYYTLHKSQGLVTSMYCTDIYRKREEDAIILRKDREVLVEEKVRIV